MPRNYYIFKSGRIKRKENTIFIETEEGRKILPLYDIDQIFIFGEMDLNTSFLNFIAQSKIIIHFFNYYGYYSGSFVPREENISGTLVIKQAEHYLIPEKRLELAKLFVEGASHNMKRNIEKREDFKEEIEKIKIYIKEIEKAESITSLMSIEAQIKKIYYSCIERITEWEFEKRTIQPPQNPLNALISFGNSLVYTQVLKAIYETPLNPAVSFLHEPGERRFSLSLDISEIFKPVLSDRLILRLIDLKIIREEHFERSLNFAYLNEEGRKIFVKSFDEKLEETILHRKLRRKIKYKNLILLELYRLIKHLLGEEKYQPLKVWF
ncbi:MAG: type I-B CRISPR-associated endonuclease Cas1b [candidate division WOR-3 bacterium]|nr:type I-B CRISPR-associated endonuclease Cas1b [candidate division WOR-3 bacterium]